MKGVYLFLSGLIISACNNGNDTTDHTSTNDTVINIEDTVNSSDTLISSTPIAMPDGIYQAKLPCSNCPGVEHTIAFYPNNTYRLEEKKLNKQASTIKTSGTWKPTGGIIYLYDDGIAAGRYQWLGDTLTYLKGTQTYKMQKLQSAKDVQVWKNKKREGIEFFGIGNEPFWNIEIDEQKWIAFHLADWSKPIRFNAVKPQKSTDSLWYSTKNDSASIKVIIYQTFCSDGMSDNIYDRKVRVIYNNQRYEGCGILYQ